MAQNYEIVVKSSLFRAEVIYLDLRNEKLRTD